ncbi:MAG: HipA domain-containing protein [Gammaproteobacteria bacterium]|nr:HipA domain-containing protein [Gammaproteobacteria bacterium]
MSRDREAVIWTRLATSPIKMGRLYLTESECRFSYELDYLHTGLPGLGLIYDPQIIQDNTIVRQRTEFFDFLPPVQFLLPPPGDKNFQRQLILNYLSKKGIQPKRGLETDWEILKVAGHGAIGHLDVFENDEKALAWYSKPVKNELFEITDDMGFSLKEFLTWFDDDAESLMNIIGPTPSVGGAIPKLLLSIADTGWDNRIGLPTRLGAAGITDVVVKFEQSNHYPGITELEALALDLHKEAGFEVPRYWTSSVNGLPVIAVERFDRDKYHNPIFTESLYSVLASGDREVTHHYSYSYDKIGRAIDKSPIDLVENRQQAKEHLFKRLILSFLTGNGDLHLENLSIIKTPARFGFSPVYDPTPMRAYPIHNMLSVMPFGHYAELTGAGSEPIGLSQAILNLAKHLALSKAKTNAIISESLQLTADYAERVNALTTLPDANKNNLIRLLDSLRQKLAVFAA